MNKIPKAPTGTFDILPEDIPTWLRVEETVRKVCGLFGYSEIRTPMFEYTSLFARSIGEVTDIVEKEMYTITRTGADGEGDEETLTLRPEVTASIVRAVIEHDLFARRPLQKLFYYGPIFRRERPQKGRFRQFHQMGVEALGSYDPLLDTEMIRLADVFLRELGIANCELLLNSMGCPECRKAYRAALLAAAQQKRDELCDNCKSRIDRNVFRVLDCKIAKCVAVSDGFPPISEFLCPGCRDHFDQVKSGLEKLGVVFKLQSRLVRGFDYYTRTVFEFSCSDLGAQSAVCGGGRYDNLIEELGGPKAGSVGFAIGLERAIMVMKTAADPAETGAGAPSSATVCPGPAAPCALPVASVFLVTLGQNAKRAGFDLLDRIRGAGIAADMDHESKSLKAQMRLANKLAVPHVLIMGDNELAAGTVNLRDMKASSETTVPQDKIISALQAVLYAGSAR
ncbi:MAG: histidine--tRNA ligase [Planctomycetota bacterium]|nr:histidine--tRNA ligase [Planctomycetota bacterium]